MYSGASSVQVILDEHLDVDCRCVADFFSGTCCSATGGKCMYAIAAAALLGPV